MACPVLVAIRAHDGPNWSRSVYTARCKIATGSGGPAATRHPPPPPATAARRRRATSPWREPPSVCRPPARSPGCVRRSGRHPHWIPSGSALDSVRSEAARTKRSPPGLDRSRAGMGAMPGTRPPTPRATEVKRLGRSPTRRGMGRGTGTQASRRRGNCGGNRVVPRPLAVSNRVKPADCHRSESEKTEPNRPRRRLFYDGRLRDHGQNDRPSRRKQVTYKPSGWEQFAHRRDFRGHAT